MSEKKYQQEVDYFYESIKSNRGPIVANIANDVNTEDSKSLNEIAKEAPENFDSSKVIEIRDYLINSEYIKLLDYSSRYMLNGITPEAIKKYLEDKFVK